jgi:hypothetical protein
MEQSVVELKGQVEAIARYLGRTFPNAGIHRYENPARNLVGFRFIGVSHASVEFSRDLLETLTSDENAVALELHLRHVGAEINATPLDQCLVFGREGLRREPAREEQS